MDKESIRKYGTKGATLKYIFERDEKVPIEPFILVPVGHDWRDYRNEIRELGECLVRSSSPLEDGKQLSFAGLFHTLPFSGSQSVDNVLESVDYDAVRRYAQIHGVNGPIMMGLVFQRNSDSGINWGMLRHPHIEELIFIQGRPLEGLGSLASISYNFVYNEKTKKLHDLDFFTRHGLGKDEGIDLEQGCSDLPNALETYKKLEDMPAFQTGFTYHMEFGSNPFSVYQFRPFRKKEQADWKLELSDDYEDGVDELPLSFGITPSEGLELILVRALSTKENKKLIEQRRNLKDLPKDIIVNRLMDLRKYGKKRILGAKEKPYAEEIADLDPDIFGSIEEEAFDRALSKLNNNANIENTCLLQEQIHFYYGEDIDLVFPNAKVWVPEGALQFLSHNWFRAMQHYDIVITGFPRMYSYRTGGKVRVYSDGRKGKIEYLKK